MNILLAMDESPYSSAAFEAVAERPWPPGATVRVLSVVEPIVPIGEMWFKAGEYYEHALKKMKDRAASLTGQAAGSLQSRGLEAEASVREGEPRSEIINEAEAWPADLIVVGSHGYTGVKRWLLGSVAQSVVSHAPCSVEIVRSTSNRESN